MGTVCSLLGLCNGGQVVAGSCSLCGRSEVIRSCSELSDGQMGLFVVLMARFDSDTILRRILYYFTVLNVT